MAYSEADLNLIRKSFYLFARNIFKDYNLYPFQRYLIEQIQKHIINPPSGRHGLLMSIAPGLGKTFLTADLLVPFLFGQDSTLEIIICSYESKVGQLMGKRARRTMELPIYKTIFPDVVIRGDGIGGTFELTNGGSIYATSFGSAITSRRASVIIADDLVKNMQTALSDKVQEQMPSFLFSTLLSRFHRAKPKTTFIHLETSWSQRAPIKLINKAYPEWLYLNIPALCEEQDLATDVFARNIGESICEEMLPVSELLHLKKNSPLVFDNLYQGRDINYKATYFSKNNLENALQLPEIPKAEKPIKVISFDTASETTESADFTVACHWLVYKDFIVVTKIDRMKVDITGLLKYYNTLKADYIICEKASSGLQLLQLKHDCIASLIFKNIVEKEASAKALNALLGNKIFIAPSALTLEIKEEILNFPFGNKDDVALSLMHGFRFINSNAPLKHKTQRGGLKASALMFRANKLEKMRTKF